MPALLWSAFIFVVCFIPGSDLPKHPWLEKIYFDKIVHAGLYFIFYLLLARIIERPGISRLAIPAMACLAQGILIECIQGTSWVQGRSFDVWDIVANLAGILPAAWIISKRGNPQP